MLKILLYIVAILAMIVGVVVFMSNRKTNSRLSAVSFAIAIFGTAFWVLFVQLYQSATSVEMADLYMKLFSVSALLVPIGCLSYAMTLVKGKVLSKLLIAAVVISSAVVTSLIFQDSNMLASTNYALGNNSVGAISSPLFFIYGSIIGVFQTIAILIVFVKALQEKKDRDRKLGLIWLGSGLILSTVLSGFFNLILPILGYMELFWVGPLFISITMLFIYFATLKYRLFVNTSQFLRYTTYMIMVAMAALAYICLFYLIFMLIFRGASPSDEITIFQFIMVVIVILLLPTINHFIEYVKKLISDNGATEQGKIKDAE